MDPMGYGLLAPFVGFEKDIYVKRPTVSTGKNDRLLNLFV